MTRARSGSASIPSQGTYFAGLIGRVVVGSMGQHSSQVEEGQKNGARYGEFTRAVV